MKNSNYDPFKRSRWQRLKWKLFGEFRLFGWLAGLYITLALGWLAFVIWVVHHFVVKYW